MGYAKDAWEPVFRYHLFHAVDTVREGFGKKKKEIVEEKLAYFEIMLVLLWLYFLKELLNSTKFYVWNNREPETKYQFSSFFFKKNGLFTQMDVSYHKQNLAFWFRTTPGVLEGNVET